MVSLIEKFLLVLGLEEGLGSESTFEVVRHFTKGVGKKKKCFIWSKDKPWWSGYKINEMKFNWNKGELKIQGKPWWSEYLDKDNFFYFKWN